MVNCRTSLVAEMVDSMAELLAVETVAPTVVSRDVYSACCWAAVMAAN